MGFYDGAQQPEADHDPNKETQWDVNNLAHSIGLELYKAILDMLDTLGDAIKDWVLDFFGLGSLADMANLGWVKDLFNFQNFMKFPLIQALIDILTGNYHPPVIYPSFPHQFPYDFPDLRSQVDPQNPAIVFLQRLLSFFNVGNWLKEGFNALDAVREFVENALKPTGLLAWLDPITGLIPNFQAPPIVRDIINTVEGAFKNIPVVGTIVQPVFDAIKGLLGIGNNAQETGNTGLSQVAAIWATINSNAVPNGVSILEDFNEAQHDYLPPTIEQTYFDSGFGKNGTSGSGRSVWYEAGSNPSGCFNRHLTALFTDYQQCTIVLPNGLNSAQNVNTYIEMELRCNATRTERVVARLARDFGSGSMTVEIGFYTVDGYTRIGAPVSGLNQKDGDIFEFRAGTGATGNAQRQFQLLQNGLTIIDRIDLTGVSKMGVNNRFTGWIQFAGVRVFFFVYQQQAAPDIDVFAAADRKVAA